MLVIAHSDCLVTYICNTIMLYKADNIICSMWVVEQGMIPYEKISERSVIL